MPSHHSHKGVKKPQTNVSTASTSCKNFFHILQKKNHCPTVPPIPSIFGGFMPQWFMSTPVAAPPPESKEFATNDCIWYYGTLYVKEAVAVARMQDQQPMQQQQVQQQTYQQIQEPKPNHCIDIFDDDDTESISSGNGSISAFKHPRSIGKQNQLKYLKDGMRLRHMILNRENHEWHEWFAVFDADTNRIIRTPDGVAFDTLRQFARLHCNEVLSTDSVSSNVWSDPNFQYKDMDCDSWHPLSNLKH